MIATREERIVADRFRIAGILWCHDPAKLVGCWDRYDTMAGPIQRASDSFEVLAALDTLGIYTDALLIDLCLYLSYDL